MVRRSFVHQSGYKPNAENTNNAPESQREAFRLQGTAVEDVVGQ